MRRGIQISRLSRCPPAEKRGQARRDGTSHECRQSREHRRRAASGGAAGSMSVAREGRRPQGWSARWSAPSRCARARRRRSALQRLGHEVIAIDVGSELVAELLEAEPDAAFIALHGRDGEDGTVQGLLEAIGIPYTGSGPAACMRCTDKVLAKHLMREAGIPTPDFARLQARARSRSSARGGAGADWSGARLPAGRQARQPGLGAGREVRALAARSCQRRSWARSPTTARSLLERYVQGTRPGGVGARLRERPRRGSRRRAAGRGGGAARRGVLRLRVAL